MAGNIIPAIATTNAIISGVIVMQALNILNGKLDKCKTVSRPVQIKQDYLKKWKNTAHFRLHCAQLLIARVRQQAF